MARTKKAPIASNPMTNKQRSRAQKEQRATRWVILAAVAVGVIVVGVLLYGYYTEVIVKAQEPVAEVNGVAISTGDFVARVRYRRALLAAELYYYQSQRAQIDPTNPQAAPLLEWLNQEIADLETQRREEYATYIGQQVLGEMIRDEIVRQEAEQRGISVIEEERELAIKEYLGISGEQDPEDPSALPIADAVTDTQSGELSADEIYTQALENFISEILEPNGLSLEDFQKMIEAQMLFREIYDIIVAEIPAEMEQVERRYIIFPTSEEAMAAFERLEGGEAWEDLVAELEADETSTATAIPLTWRTEAYMMEELGADIGVVALSRELGAIMRPLPGSDGNFYIVQILNREVRELDPVLLGFEQDRAYRTWLDEKWESTEMSEDWMEKVPTEP